MFYKECSDRAVMMLCEGKTVAEITKELCITKSNLDTRILELVHDAHLPRDKRIYKARKEDVLGNLRKLREFEQNMLKLCKEYEGTLVKFDN